ncbi:hypothetical protein [Rhodocaloribacter sp.]
MIRRSRSFLLLAGIGTIRFAVTGVGPVYPTTCANQPGAVGGIPSDRPSGSAVMPGNGTPTLVLFAHPRCPRTRASIGEPAILIARIDHPVRTHVFLRKPANEPNARAKTDLRSSAAAIPGVPSHAAPEELAARRFGAMTSGPTLRFFGGITGARGRRSDHAGPPALDVSRDETDRTTTVAFGRARYARHTISESS